jgi:hypothetical protein
MRPSPPSSLGAWRWLGLLLFAYVLARPVSTNQILLPVLAGIGALAAATIVVGSRRLAWPLVPALLLTFVFGVTGLLIGADNPGFAHAALVFVAAPLLYWLASVAADERFLRGAFTAAAWVTVFTGSVITLYVVGQTGAVPDLLPTWLLEQYGAGFGDDTYTQVRYYGLSTLVATGPMWASSLFVGAHRMLPPQSLRIAATVAATAGALTGGRRALVLVLVVVPLLAWLFMTLVTRAALPWQARRAGRLTALVATVAVGALALSPLSTDIVSSTWGTLSSFVTGSDFDGAEALEDETRTYQADRLLSEWSASPLVGHGLGATINGYARSEEQPWQWELQYHGLLFQTGLLGAALLLAGALCAVSAAVRAIRRAPDLLPPVMVACSAALGMLLGNATNPYLQAPGHLWAVFLPIALINCMLLPRGSAEGTPVVDRPVASTIREQHETRGREWAGPPARAQSRAMSPDRPGAQPSSP